MVRYGAQTSSSKKRRASSRIGEKRKSKRQAKVRVVDTWEKQDYRASLENSKKHFNSTINVKDLDLDVSYVGRVEHFPQGLPERTRWVNKGEIINNAHDVPRGWSSVEADLEPEDYDAQIARCKERIEDRIMPTIFEDRLKEFEKLKITREEKMKQYSGLEWPVVRRLENLLSLQEWYEDTMEGETEEDKHDKFDQLVNVKALITAYKSKALEVTPDLVTYWWQGVQRSQPRPMIWEEYFALWRESGSGNSFWVEGLLEDVGMHYIQNYVTVGINDPLNNMQSKVNLSLSLPDSDQYYDFEFLHDTGSRIMVAFEADYANLQLLEGIVTGAAPPRVCHGALMMYTMNGRSWVHVYTIYVNVRDPHGQLMMSEWHPIQIALVPGSRENNQWGHPRIDGPWVHYNFFTGTSPDNTDRIFFTNTKGELMRILPPRGSNAPKTGLPMIPGLYLAPGLAPAGGGGA
ncbi:uncharacterized protein N7483_003153 [Penicillium malachiteum]|uniref:uncharacterized protein n=1 Tax=Penicillium malachiteum TaxID=1324776 RepID=UPI0025475492|nr:uncharacterized protein N7483_003153 [Penicillium malachiteum]KAJ5728645.1 hypothetical protein N7483_003153 [Penicillium malachiteum]